MKVEQKKLENCDLEIKLTFDTHDQTCLNHDLLDIVEWYTLGPSQMKIESCKKRMIQENKEKLMASPEMQKMNVGEMNKLLSDPISLCDAICKMDGYMNRAQREASSKV